MSDYMVERILEEIGYADPHQCRIDQYNAVEYVYDKLKNKKMKDILILRINGVTFNEIGKRFNKSPEEVKCIYLETMNIFKESEIIKLGINNYFKLHRRTIGKISLEIICNEYNVSNK